MASSRYIFIIFFAFLQLFLIKLAKSDISQKYSIYSNKNVNLQFEQYFKIKSVILKYRLQCYTQCNLDSSCQSLTLTKMNDDCFACTFYRTILFIDDDTVSRSGYVYALKKR